MSQSLLRRLVAFIAILALPVLLAGCGGGGAAASTDGTSTVVAATTAPLSDLTPATRDGLHVTIASTLGLAKTADASTGYQWRVHVRATPTGDDLAPAQIVAAPATDGGTVTVSFGRVPPHASTIVVEVLAPSGAVVSTQSSRFTWSPTVNTTGQRVSMAVTMPLVSLQGRALTLVPPVANVPNGGVVQLRALGGDPPYGFELDQRNGVDWSEVGAHTGLYTAGMKGAGVETVTVLTHGAGQAYAELSVAPTMRIEPPSATVTPGTHVRFQASGATPGTPLRWALQRSLSGGTIDASGEYVAGRFENALDVVELADPEGNKTFALVSVSSPITIAPSTLQAASGSTRTFTASGGTGTYMWALVNNASGGSIDAQTGVYTPGPKSGVTDVVAVSDSTGAVALAQAPVAAPLLLNGSLDLTVPLRGTLLLDATGGYAPYTYALGDGHRGFIDSTGFYITGDTPGQVDALVITDSQGNTATVRVTAGPGITVTPGRVQVKPGETIQFSLTGGAGAPYSWRCVSTGGSYIDEQTGLYVAGPYNDYHDDTIYVYDANNNEGVATVSVFPKTP